MKLSYLVLGLTLLNCAGNKEKVKFPEDEIKLIDPVGPSEQYGETLHKTAAVEAEYIIKMKCRRSIYTGKYAGKHAEKTGSGKTLLITRHCVDGCRGWFYAHRYIDEDGDGLAEQGCDLAGTSVVGGIDAQKEWECYKTSKNLDELLKKAERWIKDPDDNFW